MVVGDSLAAVFHFSDTVQHVLAILADHVLRVGCGVLKASLVGKRGGGGKMGGLGCRIQPG